MLNALRRRSQWRRVSDALCSGLTARAREPVFYEALGVADTIDGRFDLLAFHAWLVLDALREAGEQEISQALVDALFVQFDEALRQQGAGDMAMGRRMTKMADAFYGRLKAYREAADLDELATALVRNLYRGSEDRLEQARALATYAAAARRHLAQADIAAGIVDFGPPIAAIHHANT